jgi:hypothetical protein
MEQSIMNFRTMHPDWIPEDDDESAFVSRVNDPLRSVNAFRSGATHRRPFLGFAASQISQGSRLDRTRNYTGDPNSSIQPLNYGKRGQDLRMPESRIEESREDLLGEDEEEDEEGQSELEHSFMTPSQAVEQIENESEGKHPGVLGLLNHLYQESGTGKGIGL